MSFDAGTVLASMVVGFVSGGGWLYIERASDRAKTRRAAGQEPKVSGIGIVAALLAVLGVINAVGGIALGRPLQAGVGALLVIAGIRLG